MATLILVLFALAGLHFIYEGIIAPSIRMGLRYRLFAMRDELRRLKFDHGERLDNELYRHVESSINATIKHLHQIDAGLAYSAWDAFGRDAELMARVERVEALYESCKIDDMRTVRDEHRRTIGLALLTNVGAWGLYLSPFALILLASSSLALTVKRVLTLPEGDVDKLVPPDHRYASA
jgi:hypothetical protein